MRINRVIFSCESLSENSFDKEELKKMEIVFDKNNEYPVLFMESENVRIEDRGLPINNLEILKGISKIDFSLINDFKQETDYCGKKWKLIINDEKYEGILEDPYYIVQLKRVIKYNYIELYALKKMVNYFKK